MLSIDSSLREFYFFFVTFALDERIELLPDSTSKYLLRFIEAHPKEFLHYFATEPSLQFGQLDDWATIATQALPQSTKAVYDASEQSLESLLSKSAADGSQAEQVVLQTLLDRLHDIKHNREERLE